jgi:hypothetical protein
MHMHGHVSCTDKYCPSKFSRLPAARIQRPHGQTTPSTLIPDMSSHSQTTSGLSSDIIPLPPDPTPIFELNQARRAKAAAELESLRSGECRNRILARSIV